MVVTWPQQRYWVRLESQFISHLEFTNIQFVFLPRDYRCLKLQNEKNSKRQECASQMSNIYRKYMPMILNCAEENNAAHYLKIDNCMRFPDEYSFILSNIQYCFIGTFWTCLSIKTKMLLLLFSPASSLLYCLFAFICFGSAFSTLIERFFMTLTRSDYRTFGGNIFNIL